MGFQDAGAPVIEEFLFFHDFTIIILVIILSFVGVIMAGAWLNQRVNTTLLEGQVVECV